MGKSIMEEWKETVFKYENIISTDEDVHIRYESINVIRKVNNDNMLAKVGITTNSGHIYHIDFKQKTVRDSMLLFMLRRWNEYISNTKGAIQ